MFAITVNGIKKAGEWDREVSLPTFYVKAFSEEEAKKKAEKIVRGFSGDNIEVYIYGTKVAT